MLAAWRPVATPSPPASNPYRRTDSSARNAWKRPIALEPPPTHAVTASGNRPVSSRHCLRASTPIPRAKSRTMAGNGCGPAAVQSRIDRGEFTWEQAWTEDVDDEDVRRLRRSARTFFADVAAVFETAEEIARAQGLSSDEAADLAFQELQRRKEADHG